MSKLCLNSRDELLFVDLNKIAFFRANGNYTNITYIEGQQQMLTMGLSKVEQVLRTALPQGKPSPFLRLGRSLIINQTYLYSISVVRQRLTLSDFRGHTLALAVPKQLLRDYKDKIASLYSGTTAK
ncbi:MAG: LytTR family transcriptional regulator [Muribaculum sp.]|nr:LytTR family transcriptional regulator [Muribaculaceae bacterium]MCM1081436.1 LytTR family transcriptional regulator [Muribaculum sp.]